MGRSDVEAAMREVARTGFLRAAEQVDAEIDGPLPIGRGQSNSQPRTVQFMLELLGVEAGQKVLDVGAGSGWTTALLARLVGRDGSVLGLELEPELAAWGAANLARQETGWASIREARPGLLGAPEEAPFDRILVSAEADELPDDLVDQLAVEGVMVVPVRGTMLRVRRLPGERDEVTTHGAFRFVPLR